MVGFIMKIREAGFSGTAVILWVDVCPKKMRGKSGDGV
jgi:hypothetical protein